MRDIGIDIPSGHLVTGHIIATDPRGHSLLPKSTSIAADADCFAKGEVVIYRVIRGTAEFKKKAGESFELSAGDVVTAGRDSISLVGVGENTQVLRLGLLKGMNDLRSWTPTQRDEIDGLASQIITHKDVVRYAPKASRSDICTLSAQNNGPPGAGHRNLIERNDQP